ncbi:MAG TPA: ATP-binding protein [Polyangia bacterium]|nr:ATP-binding protein [Polyangia bacterium]
MKLHQTKHPDEGAAKTYDGLIGIEAQKLELADHLLGVLDPDRVARWEKKHHPRGLPLARRLEGRPPLAILAGEVGCGKTALATSVATPIARLLDGRVVTLETPSDIRGGGLVGELSARVTAAFDEARTIVGKDGRGILVIDEGDDLGTSRAQMQAHHEDRAGLNVLIKQIDGLARERTRLAVILVTNRLAALDPALVRRAHVLRFERPGAEARRALFEKLLEGHDCEATALDELVRVSERQPPFTYSDLVHRGLQKSLLSAMRRDRPFSVTELGEAIGRLEPTPLIEDAGV